MPGYRPGGLPPLPPPVRDVVVVGGGPAGLSSALVLARSRRSVLVLDAGEPRNAPAGHVHGLLGSDGVPPGELLARGRADAARYGAEVARGRAVRLVPEVAAHRVRVDLDDGACVLARRVVVATGLRDELPDVAGLAALWGRDVLHCPYCHGWEVGDRRLAVLGTDATAADKALTLTQWSPDVVLVTHGVRREELPTDRLRAAGVRVADGPVAALETRADRLTGLRLADSTVLACDALVVQPLLVARDDLLRDAGVELREGPFGHVAVTDETGATGVPGVWAAGNVCDPQAQVVMAAAAGYRAALAVDHDLLAEDLDQLERGAG